MKNVEKCIKWDSLGVVKGHPRSSAMSPFDRAHRTSYSFSNRNHASILYRFRDTAHYLSKFADFTLSHLHLVPRIRVTPFKFPKDFWRQKTRVSRVPRLSCGTVCVFLCIAISVEHRLVTDRQTDRETHTHTRTDKGYSIYCVA